MLPNSKRRLILYSLSLVLLFASIVSFIGDPARWWEWLAALVFAISFFAMARKVNSSDQDQ